MTITSQRKKRRIRYFKTHRGFGMVCLSSAIILLVSLKQSGVSQMLDETGAFATASFAEEDESFGPTDSPGSSLTRRE